MSAREPVIDISGLKKTICLGKKSIEILKGVDFKVSQGEMVAIMGPSGCGKSTLLNIIGCLDSYTDGSYKLYGTSLADKKQRELAALRSRYFGFVVQDFALINDLSVWENVTIPLDYTEKKISRAEIGQLLERFGMSEMKKTRVSLLSGGEQQRVAIVRALVGKPEIILADEPTGALDSATGALVMDALRKICGEGKTIIVVTHDINVAEKCDRVQYMKDGRMLPET